MAIILAFVEVFVILLWCASREEREWKRVTGQYAPIEYRGR